MQIPEGIKKKLKVGIGGTAASGLLFVALNAMNSRVDSIKDAVDAKEAKIEAMVEYKHHSVIAELKHINEQLKSANDKIDRIDQRVYELKQKSFSAIELENETKEN